MHARSDENATPNYIVFIAVFLMSTLTLTVVCAATILLAERAGSDPLPYEQLVSYQVNKADKSYADVIFVGDSSLGNAISAKVWEDLSGEETVNLALTGTYGYAGSYLMLKRIVDHHIPKVVYIFHTINIPLRKQINQDVLARIGQRSIFRRIVAWCALNFNALKLKTSAQFLWQRALSISQTMQPGTKIEILNDYIAQFATTRSRPPMSGLDPQKIDPQHFEDLKAIKQLCNNYRISCRFVHGPMVETVLNRSGDYMRSLNSYLMGVGFEASSSPLSIPLSELGDAPEHVKASLKDDYTRRYFNILNPGLARNFP